MATVAQLVEHKTGILFAFHGPVTGDGIGADCKSAGFHHGGSSPSRPTNKRAKSVPIFMHTIFP